MMREGLYALGLEPATNPFGNPTDLIARKRESNRARTNAFADGLLRRLMEEGLSPELLRRDETTVLVRFGSGSKKVVLDVTLDPYATAWKGP